MTRPTDDVEVVLQLWHQGHNKLQIARLTGIPRETLRDWLSDPDGARVRRGATSADHDRSSCALVTTAPAEPYAYLLGLYLGDGTISKSRKEVYRLRVSCCDTYPHLMDLCEQAIKAVMPANVVGRAQRVGCTEVGSSSKHWPCLFPQHGPGRKHERPIVLTDWQAKVLESHPDQVLRGLVHSDGCRVTNSIKKNDGTTYDYPRYFFSQRSTDIIAIFSRCCDLLGVEWRLNRPNSVSIAKRASVAVLDTFIGPKS